MEVSIGLEVEPGLEWVRLVLEQERVKRLEQVQVKNQV